MAMQTVSRRIAARDHGRRPPLGDGFYGKLVEFAEEARNKRSIRPNGDALDRANTFYLYRQAEAWWSGVFLPEFARASEDLKDKSIVLYETNYMFRNDPGSGRLERVVTVRSNLTSCVYLVAVEAGKISLRKLKGRASVAIDGFHTSVDIRKSSPSHVRLMVTQMIKESLA